MNYTDKIEKYWHVPTSVFAFKKMLLENRKFELLKDVKLWDYELEKIEKINENEQLLLEKLMKRIDDSVLKEATLENLLLVTKDIDKKQNGNLVLIKYNQFVNYNDSWNNFYEESRGVVINIEKLEVQTATLRKFFNLNEKIDTSLAMTLNKMKKAKGKDIRYQKMDGSNTNISVYENKYLVTTPGAFENTQIENVNSLIKNKYKKFYDDLESNKYLTYIFEYVGPENRVVVYYPESELILLHVKNNLTGDLLSYEETKEIARKYDIKMCPIEEADLETLLEDKDDNEKYKSDEHEGWVIRIDLENEIPYFVKVKCSDYLNMHRLIDNSLNPKWILEAILNETFDDKIAAIENEKIKEITTKIADTFYEWNKTKKEELKKVFESIPNDFWLDEEEVEKRKEFVNEVKKNTETSKNQDKLKHHLYNFSKGKLVDPMEEIKIKANLLKEKNVFNLELLGDLDKYKGLISNINKKFIDQLKKEVKLFVYEGEVGEFKEFYEEDFKDLKNIKEIVSKEDYDYWFEIFEGNKGEYLRVGGSLEKNLKPSQINISRFIKKEIEYEKKLNELVSYYKKQIQKYFFKEVNDEKLDKYLDNSFIINEELFKYHLEKMDFENKKIYEFVEVSDDQERNMILNQYFLLARELESDNSYKEAKEIFENMPEHLKDQKNYIKQEGMFASKIVKIINKEYKSFIFEMFSMNDIEKNDYIKDVNFLKNCNIINDENVELKEFDIDFSFLKNINNNLAIKDE